MEPILQLRRNLWAFQEDGVRSFLVVGCEKALLVDTGYGALDYPKRIREITALPVSVVNTHGDPDHVGGNHFFPACALHPADWALARSQPGGDTDYRPLRGGEVLELGGTSLKVLGFPGHTPGSVMIYDPAEYWLLTGDSLSEEPVWLFGQGRSVPVYRESLLAFQRQAPAVHDAYPSHGSVRLANLPGITADALAAAEAALAGEPESECCRLDYDPENPCEVKLYQQGRAKLLTEIVD